MRKQIAAANWKMNLTVDKAGALLNDILSADIILSEDQLAVFAVPFPYLQQAQQQLNNRNNAAGALLNDEELAVRLKNTITNLEAASKNLNEDLLALQHNFFLRGYFKNKSKSQKTENQ